ncbi:energy-coupled thiamine transporter ThiT [Miniphocaeibacter halophilus]|uniref:Energy-coupled thiamine transporter ThiT n=1 Tax=Miniphocaeibacter halophilus TaxID=2931922 RepID=A0AC61MR18_9FIRM|nr:energy-coupled thiamine transporter ThiT [Miniphocaeibacter halophilus]QQK07753.1 energy-coupled thiamine transporter ThiT [Miniphocaeibacter halophilus]
MNTKKMNMRKVNVKMLAEAGIMIALSIVLNMIKLYKLPQGGSITPGGYVPLLLFALKWGPTKGVTVGIIYGLIDCLIDPYIIHPLQFLLDYPLAYGMLGLAGLASKNLNFNSVKGKIKLTLSVVFANFMRMVIAILSGIIFFKKFLPTNIPYVLGSFIYNISYVLPNTIICIILIFIIYPRLIKLNK